MAIKDWSVVLGRPPKTGDEVTVWAFDVLRKKPVFSVRGMLQERAIAREFRFVSRAPYWGEVYATREQAARAYVAEAVRGWHSSAVDCRWNAEAVDREVRRLHKYLEQTYRNAIAKRAALVEHGATSKQLALFEKHAAKLRQYERSVLPAISGDLAKLRDEALKPAWNAAGVTTGRSSSRAPANLSKKGRVTAPKAVSKKAPKRSTRAAKRS